MPEYTASPVAKSHSPAPSLATDRSGRAAPVGSVPMTDDSGSQEQWRRERDFLNARRHDLARSAQH